MQLRHGRIPRGGAALVAGALACVLGVAPAGAGSSDDPPGPDRPGPVGLGHAPDPELQAAADRALDASGADASAAGFCGGEVTYQDAVGDAAPLDGTSYGLLQDCDTGVLVLRVETQQPFAPSDLDVISIDIDLPSFAVGDSHGCEGFDALVEGWYEPGVGLLADVWRVRDCAPGDWGYAGPTAIAHDGARVVALAFDPAMFRWVLFDWKVTIVNLDPEDSGADLLPDVGTHPGGAHPPGSWGLAPGSSGYWMLGENGLVHAFGDAPNWGLARDSAAEWVDIEPSPSGSGYWLVTSDGTVEQFGFAQQHGMSPSLRTGEHVTSLSATPGGAGYWLFTDLGRVFAYGDAQHHGDMDGIRLNGPVLDAVPTPSGLGYYMVASDGGIFAFGDAVFRGSMGGVRLNAPVQSLVPDPDGAGYWLVASDGGVFSFDAVFRGSMASVTLNGPVSGMVPFGDGYLMVAEDGGVFSFSDLPFLGSHGTIGADPLPYRIVSVAAVAV
jgi:hypothetical protein